MSDEKLNGTAAAPAGADGEPTPIIFLDDIRVTFKTRTGSILHPNKVQAVRGLTLKLMPGQTLGIVGESGCGKSITSLTIMGLLDPKATVTGEVLYDGQNLLAMSQRQMNALRGREIAMIYQDALSSLNPSMLIKSQMKQLTKRGGTRSAEELLELVGLDPKRTLGSYPHELSGGQRQRVAIARALSLKPDAIIADEPTSALDVSVRAQILNLLMDLKRDLGLSMVFISHDIQTVRYISDRIIVMNAGVAVENGTAEEVFSNPKDEYTKLLLGAAPSLLHPELGK